MFLTFYRNCSKRQHYSHYQTVCMFYTKPWYDLGMIALEIERSAAEACFCSKINKNSHNLNVTESKKNTVSWETMFYVLLLLKCSILYFLDNSPSYILFLFIYFLHFLCSFSITVLSSIECTLGNILTTLGLCASMSLPYSNMDI